MTQNTTAPMWSDDADRQGRAAYLEAEAAQKLRRSPAELARRPLPEEAAKLAELQASVDVAVSQVEAAKSELFAALPPIVVGSARQVGGLLGHDPVATIDAFFVARQKMYAAQDVEGKARGRHTDYQMLVQAAGHRRHLAMTQDGAA